MTRPEPGTLLNGGLVLEVYEHDGPRNGKRFQDWLAQWDTDEVGVFLAHDRSHVVAVTRPPAEQEGQQLSLLTGAQ